MTKSRLDGTPTTYDSIKLVIHAPLAVGNSESHKLAELVQGPDRTAQPSDSHPRNPLGNHPPRLAAEEITPPHCDRPCPEAVHHTISPLDLGDHLLRSGVTHLHVPNLRTTSHHDALVELIRSGRPLHSITIENMRFDLTDFLDKQLAQLVLVLSKSETATGETVRST